MIRTLVASVVSAALLLAVAPADASAAPAHKSTCTATGFVNGYGITEGDGTASVDPGSLSSETTFQEFYCVRSGMRIYRSVANSETEVAMLRALSVANGSQFSPVIFCRTSPTSARMLDLAQLWRPEIREQTVREVDYWEPFALRFARARPGCHVYR